jgi:hypothetical protein
LLEIETGGRADQFGGAPERRRAFKERTNFAPVMGDARKVVALARLALFWKEVRDNEGGVVLKDFPPEVEETREDPLAVDAHSGDNPPERGGPACS